MTARDAERRGRARRTATAAWSCARARRPVATLLLSHGAGNGIEARDLAALADALPGKDVTVALLRAALAGRRQQDRLRPADARRRASRGCRGATARRRHSSSAAARPGPGRRHAARAQLGAAGLPGPGLPAAPPGSPRAKPPGGADRAPVSRPWSCRVSATRWARPRSSRERVDAGRRARGRPRPQGAARGPLTQAEALALVVEATLEWMVREVTGNPMTAAARL